MKIEYETIKYEVDLIAEGNYGEKELRLVINDTWNSCEVYNDTIDIENFNSLYELALSIIEDFN